MQIAVYHNLPSGGAKRALLELVKPLTANHRVDVYTLTSANHDFADIRPFVANHHVYNFTPTTMLASPWGRLNQALRLSDLLRLRRLARRIANDIEQGSYDLVFVHGCQYEKAPAVLHYIRGLPKIYYCQESLRHLYEPMPLRPYEQRTRLRVAIDRADPFLALYHTVLKRLDRRNLQGATRVLVNSEFSRSELQRIYQVDAQVSYLGVDIDEFQPNGATREDFVLSVGSLTPLKGFDFLIQSLAKIPAGQRPNLIIASNFQSSPEHAYLSTLATECGVELQLRSNISDKELVALYNRARMTIYAPIREPFGLVMLESMACATPVVAVCEGGIRETVTNGVTGLLTERDTQQFGAAIQMLWEQPALAAKLGNNGRTDIMQKWSWEQASIRLENHLASQLVVSKTR